jgi:uncharacterized membrane protein YphA (DoxX/SURF4 family)
VRRADAAIRSDPAASRVAWVSGAILIAAGLVKFAFHGWELRAFRSFGLPAPALLVILAGVFEVGAGVLLLARSLVAPAALLMTATMLVAIGASGIGHCDVIPSLTLAPALLLAMLYLLARGVRRRTA